MICEKVPSLSSVYKFLVCLKEEPLFAGKFVWEGVMVLQSFLLYHFWSIGCLEII